MIYMNVGTICMDKVSLNTVHMDHSINADGHLEKLTLCSLLSAVIKSVFVANWFNAIVPDDVSQTSLGGKNDFHDHLRQRGDVRFSWAEQQTLRFFPGATHLPEQNSDLALNLEKTEIQCHAAIFHSVSFSKPNPVWFGKVTLKNCVRFPNQFQFGLERKKLILKDADSKTNSDWFGKFWWPLSMSWKFQTKFSLVWKNYWPNTQSNTARWADRDTPSAGHPCTGSPWSPWCTRVQRTQSTLP